MITKTIDGISFPLREDFDFSFVSRWGSVFKVFPDQDSGNICFGVEKDGERFFLKFAGAPTWRYEGDIADAVANLKKAAGNYIALRHPCLIELTEEMEIGGGYLTVFRWTDGVCMGKMYPESREKFFTLPMEKRQKVYVDILDFLQMTAERGYTPLIFTTAASFTILSGKKLSSVTSISLKRRLLSIIWAGCGALPDSCRRRNLPSAHPLTR